MSISVQSNYNSQNSQVKNNYFKHSNLIDDAFVYAETRKKNIIRCPHDAQNPYTMIRTELNRDSSISPQCRWLITLLLGNKDNFTISPKQIINHVKSFMGRDKVYKTIKEAINAGYMVREEVRRPNPRGGMLKSYTYKVFEIPIFKKFYRYTDDQYTGNTYTKEILITKKIKKGRKKGASPSTPPAPLFLKDQVRIKQSTYDALVQEYKEPIVAMAIDRMNAYMQKTGRYKQYKCHGAKLRHWLTQDADKYEIKLKKQTQEMDSQREYARWLQAQEERKIEKEKQEKLQEDQDKVLIEKHMPILQKYIQKFPDVVKMSKYSQNGICELVDSSDTIHYLMMTDNDFEPQLTRKLDEFGYSHGFN